MLNEASRIEKLVLFLTIRSLVSIASSVRAIMKKPITRFVPDIIRDCLFEINTSFISIPSYLYLR